MLKFEPRDFLENQEATSKWCDDFEAVDWEELSNMLNKKFDEWLSQQKRVYSTCKNNTLWMRWEEHIKPVGYYYGAYLIPIEKEK